MPKPLPITERIQLLETQKQQLEARIGSLSARAQAQAKKDEMRKKFLLGTILLEDISEPSIAPYLRRRLPKVMTAADVKNGLFADLLNDKSK